MFHELWFYIQLLWQTSPAYFLVNGNFPWCVKLSSPLWLVAYFLLYVMPHSFVFTVISPLFFKFLYYHFFIPSLLISYILFISSLLIFMNQLSILKTWRDGHTLGSRQSHHWCNLQWLYVLLLFSWPLFPDANVAATI